MSTNYESEINDRVRDIFKKKLKTALEEDIFSKFTEDLA